MWPSLVSDRENGLHFVPPHHQDQDQARTERNDSEMQDCCCLVGRDGINAAGKSVERADVYVFIIVFGFTAKNYYDSSVLMSDIYECKCLVYNRSI